VACTDVVTPYEQPSRGWRSCQCGDARVRWRDPHAGVVELSSTRGPDGVRALGLANNFLAQAVHGQPYGEPADAGAGEPDTVDEEWRLLHDDACERVPRNTLFHEFKRACWSVVIRVGETGDVLFIEPGEAGL
jgi:hypothetical protein